MLVCIILLIPHIIVTLCNINIQYFFFFEAESKSSASKSKGSSENNTKSKKSRYVQPRVTQEQQYASDNGNE